MSKAQVLFTCSEEFKTLLGQAAVQRKVSVSAYIKGLIAQDIGYDLEQEKEGDKRRKYANTEERKTEQAKKQREERVNLKKFLEAFAHEEHVATAQALLDSLERKGAL